MWPSTGGPGNWTRDGCDHRDGTDRRCVSRSKRGRHPRHTGRPDRARVDLGVVLRPRSWTPNSSAVRFPRASGTPPAPCTRPGVCLHSRVPTLLAPHPSARTIPARRVGRSPGALPACAAARIALSNRQSTAPRRGNALHRARTTEARTVRPSVKGPASRPDAVPGPHTFVRCAAGIAAPRHSRRIRSARLNEPTSGVSDRRHHRKEPDPARPEEPRCRTTGPHLSARSDVVCSPGSPARPP